MRFRGLGRAERFEQCESDVVCWILEMEPNSAQ